MVTRVASKVVLIPKRSVVDFLVEGRDANAVWSTAGRFPHSLYA